MAPRSTASLNSAIVDGLAIVAGRQQGRLVDEVGQVGAGRAGRQAGDVAQIDIVGQLHGADVDFEDRFAADDVGPIDDHGAIEAAGAQQGGVERFGPVGGGHDDDAAVGVEAVHLDEELR